LLRRGLAEQMTAEVAPNTEARGSSFERTPSWQPAPPTGQNPLKRNEDR
jgi:hypothetical protein